MGRHWLDKSLLYHGSLSIPYVCLHNLQNSKAPNKAQEPYSKGNIPKISGLHSSILPR